jgi:hypothetical protein
MTSTPGGEILLRSHDGHRGAAAHFGGKGRNFGAPENQKFGAARVGQLKVPML